MVKLDSHSKPGVTDPLIPFTVKYNGFHGLSFFILGVKEYLTGYTKWDRFKSINFFTYEQVIKDWTSVGSTLGFDNWQHNDPSINAMGWGTIWNAVTNKEQVLEWAMAIKQRDPMYSFRPEVYTVD